MIRDFQEAQTQAKMSMEERMVREIRVVKPDVTGEEVQSLSNHFKPAPHRSLLRWRASWLRTILRVFFSRKCWAIWITSERDRFVRFVACFC